MKLTALKLKAFAVLGVFMLLTTGIVGGMAWEPVDEGNVKVVTEWGDATGEVLRPGANWITPVKQDTISLSTRQQAYSMTANKKEGAKTYSDPIVVKTQDGVETKFNVVVRYHLDGDKKDAVDVYTDYRTMKNAESRMIRPTVKKQFLNAAGSMKTSEVYTTDGQRTLTQTTRKALKAKFAKTGLVLDTVQITKINMPDSYERAVTQKEVAYQKEQKAEAMVAVAKQNADARIAKARGKAKSNEIIAESIEDNPKVVQIRYIEAIKQSDNKVIYLPSDKTPTLTKDTEEDNKN